MMASIAKKMSSETRSGLRIGPRLRIKSLDGISWDQAKVNQEVRRQPFLGAANVVALDFTELGEGLALCTRRLGFGCDKSTKSDIEEVMIG